MKQVLFLYTELAGYFIASLREWSLQGNQATVLHWPVNPEAPFQIPSIEGIRFVERVPNSQSQISKLIRDSAFDGIAVSGWMDKGYLQALSKNQRSGTSRILLMDTQWTGSLKQKFMSRLGGLFLSRLFTHAWVAGEAQAQYARNLGIRSSRVRTGFYTADTRSFNELFQLRKPLLDSPPKAFLYVGRYVAHKGHREMCEAFVRAKESESADWKLICAGTGEDFNQRVIHHDIEHLGFVQPQDLKELAMRSSVFVLPSYIEPWGVVVHEFAAAGFPLILSDKIGAADAFLDGNGFSFSHQEEGQLQDVFSQIMKLAPAQLKKMSLKSHELSRKNSLKHWTQTLNELL